MLNSRFVSLIFAALMIVVYCSDKQFPTKDEVRAQLDKYEASMDQRSRTAIIKSLLEYLKNPSNTSEDSTVRMSLRQLADIYLLKHDVTILEAVDQTNLEGGFANFVCEFYASLYSDSLFRERYRDDATPLRRCIGLSFSEGDIDTL